MNIARETLVRFKEVWTGLRRKPLAIGGGLVIVAVILLSIAGPSMTYWYSGSTYEKQDLSQRLADPTLKHPFGTDILGRDLLTRMLYGSRISLIIGLSATMMSVFIGVIYGAISGYFGGHLDEAMMRLVDILYSLPALMLTIVLLALFNRSFLLLVVALAIIGWLDIARIVRGQVAQLKHEQYVEAARTIGVSNLDIIGRHIIPNAMGPVIAYALLTVPSMILSEAFLSFLGLGVQPPIPSWGVLAAEGAQLIAVKPFFLIAPAAFMVVSLVSLNVFVQGLQEVIDHE